MKVETTSGIEPALPRRKKNPALAYKTHEFIVLSDCEGSNDSLDASIPVDRARMIAGYIPTTGTTQTSGGVLKNAISRISTEYRLQFNWPRGTCGHESMFEGKKADCGSGLPKKSLSMGAIKPTENISSINNTLAPVHRKKVTDVDRQGGGFELEPLVGSTADMLDDEVGEEKIREETWDKGDKIQLRAEFKTEYKKRFRPFSQYDYIEGRFKPKKEEIEPLPLHDLQDGDSWYREVLELRKKAGEYKHRGWGTELVPDHIAELYNKQMTLWEQVSRRSSLSALSLASTTPRSVSKEEKEKENNNKSSPTKVSWPRKQSPSRTAAQSSQKKVDKMEENKKEIPRSRKEAVVRHHLERTTGAVDGALLHSPTREKLEPVVSRRKDNSELAVNKSPQKLTHNVSGRSQSVGPEVPANNENRSPKRLPRGPGSTKSQMNGPVSTERQSRPTTLTTTAPFRTKSSSGFVKLPDSTKHRHTSVRKNSAEAAKKASMEGSKKSAEESATNVDEVNKEEEPKSESLIDMEPVIKSPPEPTRVKSPEQILMRSPEPVNWTVPLDTGKTFTVTQNVLEGEMTGRAHSEAKAWTPPAPPPAAPLSAPPQLPETEGWISPEPELPDGNDKELETLDASERPRPAELDDNEAEKSEHPITESAFLPTNYSTMPEETYASGIVLEESESSNFLEASLEPIESTHKPKKLESCVGPYNDFETEDLLSKSSISPPSGKSLATDVLEKARTRFDKFWGKGKESPEKEGKV